MLTNKNDLPCMTMGQFRRARRLIRRLCANYDNGNCLLLDDGDTCPCPQLITRTLICKYFRAAVLPVDRALWAEIMAGRPVKSCRVCGAPISSLSNAVKYCHACAIRERRRQDRERKRNQPRISANRTLESPAAQDIENASPPGKVSLPPEAEI